MSDASYSWISKLDDWGASPGTNQAMLDIIDVGYAKNIALMVPGPHVDHQLDALLERVDAIDISLHITLTSEWDGIRWGPLSPTDIIPGLTRSDKTFHPNPNDLFPDSSVRAIIVEVEAQLALARKKKIPISFIDSHMALCRFEEVKDAIHAFAEKEGLPFLNTRDHTLNLPKPQINLESPEQRTRESIEKQIQERVPKHTHTFFVHHHPAIRDSVSELFYAGNRSTRVADQRHHEWEFLSNPELVNTLRSMANIRLARFTETIE